MYMKRCCSCNKEKEESEFAFKNKEKRIRQNQCKKCKKNYSKTHYLTNKDSYIKRAKINTPRYRRDIKQKLYTYLQDKFCIDCKEYDPIVLEFDHKNRNTKTHQISKMINSSYSWERILKEIKKCDIRCANCHRRRTAKQFGWSKMSV